MSSSTIQGTSITQKTSLHCGKCGALNHHPENLCPNLSATACCGADSLCRTCPLSRRTA